MILPLDGGRQKKAARYYYFKITIHLLYNHVIEVVQYTDQKSALQESVKYNNNKKEKKTTRGKNETTGMKKNIYNVSK